MNPSTSTHTMTTGEQLSSSPTSSHATMFHPLSHAWCLWAHLPHDTDWSLASYKKMYTFRQVEEVLAVVETLPDALVKNCMLFLMREGIQPMWEDPQNRYGGCFSYKVANKTVYEVWKDLTYLVVGNTISMDDSFVSSVTGITISPKKNFCILKIWMRDCAHQNPASVSNDVKGLMANGCLFKKHSPEY